MSLYSALFILITLFFISCNSNHAGEKKTTLASHLFSITDNEDNGIKEIIRIYGGECEYGFSKSSNNSVGRKNAFWLEIRKSATIDEARVKPELIGSNIAYLFYRNLKKEKNKYSEIQARVKQNEEDSEFAYPVSALKTVAKGYAVVDQLFSYIRNNDFKTLIDHIELDTSAGVMPAEEMTRDLKEIENRHGIIKELIPYGFHFLTSEDGRELLYLAAVVVREKENHPLSVVLDPFSNEAKVYMLKYDF